MGDTTNNYDFNTIASAIDSEIQKLPVKNTPHLRAVRKRYSKKLKQADPEFILDLAREIFITYGYRWISYELIRYHKDALRKIGEVELTEFGKDINSWSAVDAFAGFLAGPAWQLGQIPDKLIHRWAHSQDRWWRRTALVSTVVLNRKSFGGKGDIPRTLEICKVLIDDHDDMVVKAMSWALRELIPHDAEVVRDFLRKYDHVLASRIKREVNNKLTTGLKNPKREN